ncbi:ABC transporter substrate-binding protein [Desulfolucanica intricata]|uniref:ABC transporter substrate-binding protein n=1 Tax=Desulfolucanica intricata TaxID=1285191 RepID=UPI00082D1BAF|nr:ABC transporter substrate-binding protein [Desulfolucanica intricata]
MRKFGLIILLAALTLILTSCGSKDNPYSQNQSEDKTLKVGITQFVAHPALDLDQKGFLDQMKEEGFIEGENVEFDIKNSQGDPNLAKTVADKFVADKVDLILAITTPSSLAAAQATKGTGIPVVFIAVSDAVKAGLIEELDQPTGTNITGVYSADPVEQQMDLIQEIQPSVKKLGVIYNAGEANSVSNVEKIKDYLSDKVEVVEVTVAGSSEVQAAAQSLVGSVDAVFMPQDNTVMSAVEALIKVCQDNDIPLYTGDTESVKKGALATLGNDEYDCGRQGAVIAARILNGEKAGNIVPEEIRKRTLLVNQKAAGEYGIKLPQKVLSRADEVIK